MKSLGGSTKEPSVPPWRDSDQPTRMGVYGDGLETTKEHRGEVKEPLIATLCPSLQPPNRSGRNRRCYGSQEGKRSGESHASPHYVLRDNQPTVLTPEAGNGRGGVFKEPHLPHCALHSDQLTEGERSSEAPDAMTGWVETRRKPAHNLYTSFTLRGESKEERRRNCKAPRSHTL